MKIELFLFEKRLKLCTLCEKEKQNLPKSIHPNASMVYDEKRRVITRWNFDKKKKNANKNQTIAINVCVCEHEHGAVLARKKNEHIGLKLSWAYQQHQQQQWRQNIKHIYPNEIRMCTFKLQGIFLLKTYNIEMFFLILSFKWDC